MGAGAGQTGGMPQQMPQQTAMAQAMPVGAPAQSNKGGLGALAAQRQQAGQADPRLMSMMQALGGNRPQPAMPMSQQAAAQASQMQTAQRIPLGGPGFSQGMQMGQPPSGFDAFMQQRQQQDAMNAQRAMQNGTMPQFEAQMRQRDMEMQGITQADIDRMRNLQMSGDPSFQRESDAFNARANANRMAALQAQFAGQGGMPGAGMMPPGGVPTQQAMLDQIRQANPNFGQPQMPMPQMPGMAAPGGGLIPDAQRPIPVGAGGKGAGVPRPGLPVRPPIPMPPGSMINKPRPMPPGVPVQRPIATPRSPGSMVNPTRPSVPKPVSPRFNQIMPFLR